MTNLLLIVGSVSVALMGGLPGLLTLILCYVGMVALLALVI
jgi:hypothetical protein